MAGAVISGLILSLAGCGTLFYPERKGQLQGRIDPGVAIADGLGLLLFIIPGVIAYAVDFSNNTIYLPGSGDASIDSVHYDGHLDGTSLAALIETRTGRDIEAGNPRWWNVWKPWIRPSPESNSIVATRWTPESAAFC
ncbi:hypothetical protein [Salinicola acroporae]|uniref:hypothetical protein n=1 Tax=Salinicola acroporae TaxID=1541440 RepID=UPI002456FB99|nr:hypothetical protein [Salinicola acroporae]